MGSEVALVEYMLLGPIRIIVGEACTKSHGTDMSGIALCDSLNTIRDTVDRLGIVRASSLEPMLQ